MPQPDIVWYKDALPIDPVKTPRYRVLVGGSLQVNGLLPDDTGMFQCFARNMAGEVQTNTYLAVTSECPAAPHHKICIRKNKCFLAEGKKGRGLSPVSESLHPLDPEVHGPQRRRFWTFIMNTTFMDFTLPPKITGGFFFL